MEYKVSFFDKFICFVVVVYITLSAGRWHWISFFFFPFKKRDSQFYKWKKILLEKNKLGIQTGRMYYIILFRSVLEILFLSLSYLDIPLWHIYCIIYSRFCHINAEIKWSSIQWRCDENHCRQHGLCHPNTIQVQILQRIGNLRGKKSQRRASIMLDDQGTKT